MDLIVISPSHRATGEPPNTVVLKQDEWNDFSFQTQYHLYVYSDGFSGRVGAVKILKRGQTKADGLQLKVGRIPPLSEDYCSLGQELDYYERLAELPTKLRQEILLWLRDALAFPEHANSFFNEYGWKTSVLRDVEWTTFSRDAAVLLERDYNKVARLGLKLSFQAAGWQSPLSLEFDAPNDELVWHTSTRLPERIAVLTGRNGSGKSTILARLARVLHASQRQRASEELKAIGAIEPKGIGFTRIVNVAYSAFDTFQLPGSSEAERKQIADELAKGTGRYYFCGLRDIGREFEEGLVRSAQDASESLTSNASLDRQRETVLKPAFQLAHEFSRTIDQIRTLGRTELYDESIRVLTAEPSLQDLGDEPTTKILLEPEALFRGWSTGHKIVMHAIAFIVAYTQSKSIVLIDEPETHLHPPLLAAFMQAIRMILERNDAFAVVATHSPVVVQETLAQHVSIIRRSGQETVIHKPRIETFGESIGEITDEVFGLVSVSSGFHQTLASFVESGMDLEQIESLFDRGLSFQARAYVMSEISRRS